MDRGHPVRRGQLLGMGFLSLPRSPCFSQGLVSLAAKGANSRMPFLFLACTSLYPYSVSTSSVQVQCQAPGCRGLRRQHHDAGGRSRHSC